MYTEEVIDVSAVLWFTGMCAEVVIGVSADVMFNALVDMLPDTERIKTAVVVVVLKCFVKAEYPLEVLAGGSSCATIYWAPEIGIGVNASRFSAAMAALAFPLSPP